MAYIGTRGADPCVPIFLRRPMSDYKVRVGRQELNVKCSYDAAAATQHFAARAAERYGIDPHRVALTGTSGGHLGF